MQLHGGCRFAPGASAARAEPLHVLVLSGRAAVPGHGERGTAKRAGDAPSASSRLALVQREPAASGELPWRMPLGYGRCANMFRKSAVVNGDTFSPTCFHDDGGDGDEDENDDEGDNNGDCNGNCDCDSDYDDDGGSNDGSDDDGDETAAVGTAVAVATAATITATMTSGTPISVRGRPEECIYRAASENQIVTAMAAACSSGALLPDF